VDKEKHRGIGRALFPIIDVAKYYPPPPEIERPMTSVRPVRMDTGEMVVIMFAQYPLKKGQEATFGAVPLNNFQLVYTKGHLKTKNPHHHMLVNVPVAREGLHTELCELVVSAGRACQFKLYPTVINASLLRFSYAKKTGSKLAGDVTVDGNDLVEYVQGLDSTDDTRNGLY
jgi:hypothetical protein